MTSDDNNKIGPLVKMLKACTSAEMLMIGQLRIEYPDREKQAKTIKEFYGDAVKPGVLVRTLALASARHDDFWLAFAAAMNP
jgi:hypothetical protein